MGKGKIGEDVIDKKGGIITSAKESKEYEEWIEAKKAEEAEEIEGKKLKTRMPEEGQPTDEQLIREKEEEMQKLAEVKRKGLLKSVHVREHQRRPPKTEEEEEE